MRFFHSLSHGILIGLLIFGTLLITVSFFLSRETSRIHQQAMNDHGFLSLLSTVLEVRRYEKSYFIYHEKSAFESALSYLDQTDRQLREQRGAILSRPGGENTLARMIQLSVEYREAFLRYPLLLEQDPKATQALEISLHQKGKQLIGLAEQLAADTEDNLVAILQDIQRSIILFNIVFIGLSIVLGIFFWRRAVTPLRDLQEGLSGILEGRLEQIDAPCRDQEIVTLTRMLNLTLKNSGHNRDERSRQGQFVFSDVVLSRLVKTLERPMANISTTCQILLEDERIDTGVANDLLLRIQQQAEQGSRLLTAIQEYANAQEEPNTVISVAQLLDRVVTSLQSESQSCPTQVEVASDLMVVGNFASLEQGLNDWIVQSLAVASDPGSFCLRARRLSENEMRTTLERSLLRPLVWLPSECHEVVELSLPWEGEIPAIQEQGLQDVSWLCLPEDMSNPGICLLPGIIRRHGGAMLVEALADGRARFALWLPMSGERKETADSLVRDS
ncbi:MAG: hypothetical protein HQM00_08450 [Magnetococcales bacterium]|nr:hypothetical protein [Magnetococcales bacterium]